MPNEIMRKPFLKYMFFCLSEIDVRALSTSVDEELSAIAQKSLKEVRYHYTHTSSWMKIFAQGTEESRERLTNAIENIWEYTKGLFAHVEGKI